MLAENFDENVSDMVQFSRRDFYRDARNMGKEIFAFFSGRNLLAVMT